MCNCSTNVPSLNLIQKSARRGVKKLCSPKLCLGNIFSKIVFLTSAVGPDLKVLSINSLKWLDDAALPEVLVSAGHWRTGYHNPKH